MPVQAPLWLEQCWQQEAGDNCPGMTDSFCKLRYELRLCLAVKLTSWVLEVEHFRCFLQLLCLCEMHVTGEPVLAKAGASPTKAT